MYLKMLNESQKELFLELAYDLAVADGNYSSEEQKIIAGYCEEMQMNYGQKLSTRPINEIIELIRKGCQECEKRIIVFEAIGLAVIDSKYDKSERKIIESMIETFELENGFEIECEELIKEYMELQNRMNKLVIRD